MSKKMTLDLRLKEQMIKNSVERDKKRNEEIKKLPENERIALALEMGFPYVPALDKKEAKKAS